jgi:hypothetical protein
VRPAITTVGAGGSSRSSVRTRSSACVRDNGSALPPNVAPAANFRWALPVGVSASAQLFPYSLATSTPQTLLVASFTWSTQATESSALRTADVTGDPSHAGVAFLHCINAGTKPGWNVSGTLPEIRLQTKESTRENSYGGAPRSVRGGAGR